MENPKPFTLNFDYKWSDKTQKTIEISVSEVPEEDEFELEFKGKFHSEVFELCERIEDLFDCPEQFDDFYNFISEFRQSVVELTSEFKSVDEEQMDLQPSVVIHIVRQNLLKNMKETVNNTLH